MRPATTLTDNWRASAAPRHVVRPLALGVLSGGFAAWAYYGETFNQLSHAFGLWIVMVVLVSARRHVPEAVGRAVLGLAAAVLSFYVGKKIMYGIEYPGMPYALNLDEIAQWLVLALPAGLLLGWCAALIGRPTRAGTLATAALTGLLVADTYRRVAAGYWSTSSVVLVVFCVLAVALVIALGARSARQLVLVLAATPVFAVLGFVLVSAPDALEQLVITGSVT